MRYSHLLLAVMFSIGTLSLLAQDTKQAAPLSGSAKEEAIDMKKFKLYHPEENAQEGLDKAIARAKAEGKHVFVQIGGNWCIWCARFNQFITKDAQIDSAVNASYVVYHMNYSPENRNKPILEKMGFPQRFGFPVFIVLDAQGKQLHTQNSAYLEQDKSYSKAKVMEFFETWSPGALDPSRYKNY
jgi:thiol:disulfide interchange protein